jgi:hypothetical protein
MSPRRFGVSKSRPVAPKPSPAAKKVNPLGTDLALTMPTAQGKPLPLTY